jgi:crossover junction endodeoxyribonuclease RuvC
VPVNDRRATSSIRVLGVDPGTVHTGWGVIERQGSKLVFCAAGVITAKAFRSLPERLRVIYAGLVEVIDTWTPQIFSLEKAFLAYNVQSAFRLGEARGVALLAAAQAGLRISEYNPTEIKTAVVGYGRAEKTQIQKAVFALVSGSRTPQTLKLPVDATDALAAAICHLNTARLADRIQEAERRNKKDTGTRGHTEAKVVAASHPRRVTSSS